MSGLIKKMWGEATVFLDRPRAIGWIDVLVLIGVAGIFFGLLDVSAEWRGPHRTTIEIDLAPSSLFAYTFFSLCRGLLAYVLSLGFTIVYGYWAAKDRIAEKILVPLLDILQSIPVLGFMPALVLALVTRFPNTNVGLELAAVIMMFTGQVWNMTFSFHQSLRAVPQDLREVSAVYRFTWWERLKWVELPFTTIGLVWNSMMSMAGGWFFLMINAPFVLGNQDFRLPGIGSYMSVAVARGDIKAMAWAIVAMITMIVALDQFLWRPVVVWAQKFRVEEGGATESQSSWFLNWLHRSRLLPWIGAHLRRLFSRPSTPAPTTPTHSESSRAPWSIAPWLSKACFGILLIVLWMGTLRLAHLLTAMTLLQWGQITGSALWTLGRVLVAVALGTLWTVPAGLAIGLSPRLARIFQPIVQVTASFPAPMLFPAAIAVLTFLGVPLGWGSIVLMLLGTQWYILFNVIAGAIAIPADLREAAHSYRFPFWEKLRGVYLPAIFPYLVTGWVTAAGGAWNASIVSEYVTFQGHVVATWGLGARISDAAANANFPMLAASVVVMSAVVVLFNRTVWRTCFRLAEGKFSLNK